MKIEWFRKSPAPGPRIKSGQELLASNHVDRVSAIYKLTGVSHGSFELLYRPALERVAEHVQQLPGSEYHHHAHPGGLLVHILDVAIYALRIRGGLQLPVGESPEVIRLKADIYTYAVFVAALAHDVGKPVVDMEVMLYDRKGNEIGLWNPYEGSMRTPEQEGWKRFQKNKDRKAKFYTFRYRKERKYSLHNLAGPVFLQRFVPPNGLQWIASDTDILYECLQFLNGNHDESPQISKIVARADQTSVSRSLGAENTPQTGAVLSKTPLPEKIKRAMKVLAAEATTTFNSRGGIGWFDGQFCWVMSKRFVDELRAQLESEGHTGIPAQNNRLFDILVESGIIVPNQGKAIWKATIELDDWKPEVFTLLKVNKSFLWTDGNEIDPFNGHIRVVETHAGASKERPITATLQRTESPQEDGPSPTTSTQTPGDDADTTSKTENHGGDLSSLFVADTSDKSARPASTDPARTIGNETGPPLNYSGERDGGTEFLFWLRNGIQNRKIRYNGSEYPVHILKEGVFLVSPVIFKTYGQSANKDWNQVQSAFQKLRINVKNKKGENWHTVRVQGVRNISTLKGWLVPVHEVFDKNETPLINPHLTLLEDR
ncbi:MAG: TraI domain-containing protein [Gammaproteobacteria bacterium]|nr:TraI domain-containing protein [Gammaproteobacteria bacterium]